TRRNQGLENILASPDFDLTSITSLAPKSGKTKGCISSSFVISFGSNKAKRLKINEIEQPEVLQSRFRVALHFCLHILGFQTQIGPIWPTPMNCEPRRERSQD
ncbi:hypothetical protein CVT26_010039, partial [Gymnopilus dilepis]